MFGKKNKRFTLDGVKGKLENKPLAYSGWDGELTHAGWPWEFPAPPVTNGLANLQIAQP